MSSTSKPPVAPARSKLDLVNFRQLYNRTYGEITQRRATKMMPEQLFQLVIGYFEWAESTPLNTPETANFQGVVGQGQALKIRPFTNHALCLYLNISGSTWQKWRTDPEFMDVVEFADEVIREQKFSGAAAGVFNAGFIMKDLNMDNSTVKSIGDPDQPLHVKTDTDINLSPEAIQALVSKL